MARLSISCLGPFHVTLDGQPITSFKSNKVRALLAYLAVEADRPHPREVLAGLLWPDWPDRDALSNLRYSLSDLRGIIGDRPGPLDRDPDPSFLLITRDSLQFNSASDCWLDVAAFTDPSSHKDLSGVEQAVDLYRGSFMEGFSFGDSALFEEWVLVTRERLARQMSSALHHLAAAYEQRGEYDQAHATARRQLERDPWDEAAHQVLMRTLALSGQRSAALAQYKSCRRLLDEELDVEPSAETTRLYEQIRTGTLKGGAPPPPPLPDLTTRPPPFLREESSPAEVPVFVARDHELAQLDAFLDRALDAQGRVVFVTGEAGSGKTSLIQEFTRRVQAAHGDLIAATGNCNAYTGIGDPYLPFREILELLTGDVEAGWAAGAVTTEYARRLWNSLPLTTQALLEAGPDLIGTFVSHAALTERATTCTQWINRQHWLARLDGLEERKPVGPGRPSPQQSDLFEQYTRVLQSLARQVPLVLLVDDLQWADLGSISLLFHLGRQLAGSRILIVGAYRSEEVAIGREGERHPLETVVNEFQREFGDITANLGQAESRDFVEALLDSEPNRLGRSFRQMLYRQTRGHPLFTVELLQGLQERGDLRKDPEDHWVEGPALDWERLPARVEAVIAERIGRLARPLQAALRVASVEGEKFTAEVVARVQAADRREVVGRLSSELDRRHRLVRALAIERVGSRRLSRYRFRNYLFQRYLYDSLDKVERAYLHEDVGNALEELYGDQASEIGDVTDIAVQLAWHFQEAGIANKAIDYLRRAGERAVQLSAYQEGIAHLTKGLALLESQADPAERARQELALQVALGMAWVGHTGYGPQTEEALTRARDLCHQTGDTTQLCRVVGGLSILHYVRAEYQRARELAEETLDLAQQVNDPLLVTLGHWQLGFVLFCLGKYAAGLGHLEQVLAFYSPEQHHRALVMLRGSDPGPSALAYAACCLWCLGYPDQAATRSQEALALAQELGHPFSLADVLAYGGCLFNEMRRNAPLLCASAEELKRLTTENVQGWVASATWYWGEALARLGFLEDGIAEMREGLERQTEAAELCNRTGCLCSMAEAQGKAGRPEDGLSTLARALLLVEQTDERYYEPELLRLHGELLLAQGDQAEAEVSLHSAIELARRHQAKSWELRATLSLSRLWQTQGRKDDARRMLTEVYDWFTEGFDSRDLQEARGLLEELF